MRDEDGDPGDLGGTGAEIADLDAEAAMLELLERALRTEARRHGVAIDPGGPA